MDFNEIKTGWQNDVRRPPEDAELRQSLVKIQQKCTSLNALAHRRDVREILEAFLVVGFFIAGWALVSHSVFASVGVGLIVLGYFINLCALLSNRKSPPVAFDASLLESLQQRLAWVDRQIHALTRTVWWWTAPSLVGVPLVAWGLTRNNVVFFAVIMICHIVTGVYYFRSRSKKATIHWKPVRRELQQAIESLS